MSFTYAVHATHNVARAGTFDLPHGGLRTPVFMPVATQGAMKGVTVEMLEELDLDIILGNTYHLGLLPGKTTLEAIGGLHALEGWRRNFLTDSGGFQLVSLLQLSTVTEEGVLIGSTHGSGMLTLRPEDSIHIQNAIGSDIMMQLDDVISTLTVGPRVEESMRRSIRWLDRCMAANKNPTRQCVFGIIQGALDHDLRRECVAEMAKRGCKGYAIGGLSGGERKDDFWRVVKLCAELLPQDRPRYCMGVGHPIDIIVCIALGVDMFDCVYPCRTARFGTALTSTGNLNLKHRSFENDVRPLDSECSCRACTGYTRAYLHTIAARESLGATMLSIHNIAFLVGLTRKCRQAIINGTFPAFAKRFVLRHCVVEEAAEQSAAPGGKGQGKKRQREEAPKATTEEVATPAAACVSDAGPCDDGAGPSVAPRAAEPIPTITAQVPWSDVFVEPPPAGCVATAKVTVPVWVVEALQSVGITLW